MRPLTGHNPPRKTAQLAKSGNLGSQKHRPWVARFDELPSPTQKKTIRPFSPARERSQTDFEASRAISTKRGRLSCVYQQTATFAPCRVLSENWEFEAQAQTRTPSVGNCAGQIARRIRQRVWASGFARKRPTHLICVADSTLAFSSNKLIAAESASGRPHGASTHRRSTKPQYLRSLAQSSILLKMKSRRIIIIRDNNCRG